MRFTKPHHYALLQKDVNNNILSEFLMVTRKALTNRDEYKLRNALVEYLAPTYKELSLYYSIGDEIPVLWFFTMIAPKTGQLISRPELPAHALLKVKELLRHAGVKTLELHLSPMGLSEAETSA